MNAHAYHYLTIALYSLCISLICELNNFLLERNKKKIRLKQVLVILPLNARRTPTIAYFNIIKVYFRRVNYQPQVAISLCP